MEDVNFRGQVDKAIEKIKKVLEINRQPHLPEDVSHKYEDKYHLAEFLTSTALASILNSLEFIGLNDKKLLELVQWAKSRSVTLRLQSEEKCTFIEKKERVEVSPTAHVTDISSNVREDVTSIKRTVQTTIKEWFWKFEVHYALVAYQGNLVDQKIVLLERKGNCQIITLTESTPRPSVTVVPPIELNISWIFKYLKDSLALSFNIDRASDACRTPRRNPQIDDALSFYNRLRDWSYSIQRYFVNLFPVQVNHGLDTNKINAQNIFVPVIPVFEDKVHEKDVKVEKGLVSVEPYAKGPILPLSDLNQFLAEEKRGLAEKFGDLAKMFPSSDKILTVTEAQLVSTVLHLVDIANQYQAGVQYIESMLYKQLTAAIGKVVTPVDFANYMKFHNRRLFKTEYEPIPFCYAIRRPDHYPEGILSIESNLDDGSISEPLPTVVRSTIARRPMKFALNAATKISFMGERHLHAMIMHEFSGQSGQTLNLVARARQFSSFIILVGRIISADQFEPKLATIIANKDDLKIPLLMETIPTPKEFRDAIESLSPEQQRFAKAFRSMQLSSTLFAICIIQIKPQLEKLLRINNDSLTKEIRLTQDLMELFIKYQIPSDLLSYEGDPNAAPKAKIDVVKSYVTNMQSMIQDAQKKELEEKAKEYAYDTLSMEEEIAVPRRAAPRSAMKSKASAIRTEMRMERSAMAAPKMSKMSLASAAPAIVQTSIQASTPVKSSAPAQAEPQIPEKKDSVSSEIIIESSEDPDDYTNIPTELDRKFEILDTDSALRPTIINTGPHWTKSYLPALLASPSSLVLSTPEQEIERNKAFDLLDALTRSGCLVIDQASLHVVMAATHCFDQTLIDTVIQDNVNPIEKVERSALIVATTIHNKPAIDLVKTEQLERVSTYSPTLFVLPSEKYSAITEKK